ncbi:type II toxin-antitoxin system RelE/ParE family toxin [Candidatus Kaiserbacteria bacterium]|nr:type II toxin-antitoxin system RelE/ParE family toxin [Candidatus Kaiserbacteria bacterium]
MYKVLLKRSAQKELDTLPKSARSTITSSLEELTVLGIRARNTKKLHDPLEGYRMRVGDYRILFDINDTIILVYRISKRADAYR